MLTFSLGNSDFRIPAIQLGTAEYGASIDEQEAFRQLDFYCDQGGGLVDTALVYGRWMPGGESRSEKLLGRWLAARRGSRPMIATKGGHPVLDDGSGHAGPLRLAPEDIRSDLDESLQNLGLEQIDLYYLHRDDPTRPVEEIMDTLHFLRQAGKLRLLGASNWSLARLCAANRYAASKGYEGFRVCQNQYSAAILNPEGILDPTLVVNQDEDLPLFRNQGILFTAFSSQARGYFAKLHEDSAAELPHLTRLSYENAANRARWAVMEEIAAETGWPVAQIALAYLTSQGVAAVIGARTLAQLKASLPAGELHLTPEMILSIAQIK